MRKKDPAYNLKSVSVYDTSLPVAPELIISSDVAPELIQDNLKSVSVNDTSLLVPGSS